MPTNANAQILINQQIAVKRTLDQFVDIMGVEARNHFVRSFKNQGFTDATIEKWEPRKDTLIPRNGYRDTGAGNRAILVKSGDLMRSIKVVSKTSDSVTIGSDLPYAQIHNEGGKGLAFGKHPFDMPKREFMGNSATLIDKLKRMLQSRMNKIFK